MILHDVIWICFTTWPGQHNCHCPAERSNYGDVIRNCFVQAAWNSDEHISLSLDIGMAHSHRVEKQNKRCWDSVRNIFKSVKNDTFTQFQWYAGPLKCSKHSFFHRSWLFIKPAQKCLDRVHMERCARVVENVRHLAKVDDHQEW